MGARIFGPKVTRVSDDQEFGLLDNHLAKDGYYVYGQADGAVAAGGLVRILESGQVDEITTAESAATAKTLGIAQAALADNQYGWFWRGVGQTEALLANGVTADVSLTTTATAGVLGTGGDAVTTLRAIDANASGSAALGTVYAYGFIGSN